MGIFESNYSITLQSSLISLHVMLLWIFSGILITTRGLEFEYFIRSVSHWHKLCRVCIDSQYYDSWLFRVCNIIDTKEYVCYYRNTGFWIFILQNNNKKWFYDILNTKYKLFFYIVCSTLLNICSTLSCHSTVFIGNNYISII